MTKFLGGTVDQQLELRPIQRLSAEQVRRAKRRESGVKFTFYRD